jgi:alpha-glucosidase
MHDTLRFWLDRGVDGFRVDVVHALVKRADLADAPEGSLPGRHPEYRHHHRHPEVRYDVDATIDTVRGIRRVLDEYAGDRAMVGEVYILDTAKVARFYGDGGDEALHLAFNFPPLLAPWTADSWRAQVARVVEHLDTAAAWPTWVLSNHDNARHRTRYGSAAAARAAAVLLLTLRGTPFLYAGEELGLEDAVVPPERVLDPGGRDGCRAPVPWTSDPDHGWGTTDPWLPWPPDADTTHAATEATDDTSVLALYRRLLAERRASPALHLGDFAFLADGVPADVLAYERTLGADRRVVLVNFAATEQAVDGFDALTPVLTSDGHPFDGRTLAPNQAVLLR